MATQSQDINRVTTAAVSDIVEVRDPYTSTKRTIRLDNLAAALLPMQLPTYPTGDGTYKLRLTIATGVATFTWVADS